MLTPRPRPRTTDSSVKADPPPPPCLPCGWVMIAHTPASAPHCRQFSEGGPSPTSLPTLRVGHGCSHPCLGPALQTVQWRRTLPHLPAYLAGGPWVLTPRPRPRNADSSVKADPPPPPCLPCGWSMGAHTLASAPQCRQFSEGWPSPTSLPTLRVGHGCSHPGLGPALQTVQWRRTLPHIPAYLAGGPWVLTPRSRPRTADSSVKADPPPPPCLPCGSRVLTPRPRPRTEDSSVKADPPPPPCLSCGWAMGAHTPASAPHCRQFSEGGPFPTSLPTLRVGHGCSPRPRPRTADSSVKADPPPPPCLPCGWAMGAHTPASAPHCRPFSEGGPSPTSLPTLRVGHGCSHPCVGPALQTVQWRRTLPHLPAYLAGRPWVLTPRPRPHTADSSVKADPPPPPSLTCGWAMGAHNPFSAPHCRQFSEGGPSPTSLPTLRV